ncbi:MAG: hypothetical protein H0W62_05310 [Chitinophagales bacterium]|nr:hypothetical protein [Chitinophagales bacterium]
MKYLAGIAILLVYSSLAFAQTSDNRKGIIYNHELSGGLSLHTTGWGVFVDKASRTSLRRKTIYEFEFTQIHSPKEIKQTIDFGFSFLGINSPKPFVYGKQNNFYQLHASLGREILIAERAEKSGVQVGIKAVGGLSLGLLKPYYLDLLYPVDNTTSYRIETQKYTSETADKFLDWFSIYGGAGFAYGLGEIKVIPGLHFKSGLTFDWATYDDFVKTLEVGVSLEAYYKRIPVMVIKKNAQFYPNVYLSVQFGKKW